MMKNVIMEKQLSWFALLMTAFYSLLASCRAEDCGPEELARCARPLEKMTSASADFITTKEGLDQLCPDLAASMHCVRNHATRCMPADRREHFLDLYRGTNEAVRELCQDGPYQERFLQYMPCMQEVKPQFDLCSKTHTTVMQSIANGDHSRNQMKAICCSFQDYLGCSRHAVLRKCGKDAAEFTKEFLDRMSLALIKKHCTAYAEDECTGDYVNGGVESSKTNAGLLLHAVALIVTTAAGRYLH